MQAAQIRLPYTVKEVAQMCGKTVSFVYKEIYEGRLHARHKRGQTKQWYVTDEDIEQWLEEGMWKCEEE